MILDERLEFVDSVALNTGAPATFLLGDVIDLTDVRDIGAGEPMWWVSTVQVAAAGVGSSLVLNLITDDNAAMTTPAIIVSTPPRTTAQMVAGLVIAAIALPIEGVPYERFLGISQTTVAVAFTAGQINSFLTHDVGKWRAYADAVN